MQPLRIVRFRGSRRIVGIGRPRRDLGNRLDRSCIDSRGDPNFSESQYTTLNFNLPDPVFADQFDQLLQGSPS